MSTVRIVLQKGILGREFEYGVEFIEIRPVHMLEHILLEVQVLLHSKVGNQKRRFPLNAYFMNKILLIYFLPFNFVC